MNQGKIRIAFKSTGTESQLRLIAQMGATDVVLDLPKSLHGRLWPLQELSAMRRRLADRVVVEGRSRCRGHRPFDALFAYRAQEGGCKSDTARPRAASRFARVARRCGGIAGRCAVRHSHTS